MVLPSARPAERDALLAVQGTCGAELWIRWATNGVVVTLTNATAGVPFDLFRTFNFVGDSAPDAFWHWVGRGTNGQSFPFTNCACPRVFYLAGCTNDQDGDGLTDAFERLVNKTSPTNTNTLGGPVGDFAGVDRLVNDLEQDCANEQNTQFESACAVLNSNVIVAYVDSNRGVYLLGQDWDDSLGWFECPTNRLPNITPRFVGYALSSDGGATFQDKDAPPNDANGDAGDPVLAVAPKSGIVCLVGTSPRSDSRHKGLPFWKSTNGGLSFTGPTVAREELQKSDKPWLAVDERGTNDFDVYLTCVARSTTYANNRSIWLMVSTDGQGNTWTNAPLVIRDEDGTNVHFAFSSIVQVGADHTAYVVWLENNASGGRWLKMRTVSNRGQVLGGVSNVCQLLTDSVILDLQRSNTATSNDTFKAQPFPVFATNPSETKAKHLYVAYADRGTYAGDKADVFLVCSTNGGTNWTTPVRVNSVWTNDQWMPLLAVKPDGTQLFLAWYDRRNDTNSSLIDVYGRWGTIAENGTVNLGTEFRLNTASFPPVFAGKRAEAEPLYAQPGYYDPVYPPGEVNLNWHYSEWPPPYVAACPPGSSEDEHLTDPLYVQHVGEYNGVCADGWFVYVTWADNRLRSGSSLRSRYQGDIRVARLPWPEIE